MRVLAKASGSIEGFVLEEAPRVGRPSSLVFRVRDDQAPPFTVRILDPGGNIVLDRVLREIPTGGFQSAPPISYLPTRDGEHKVEVRELYGKGYGEGLLNVGPA